MLSTFATYILPTGEEFDMGHVDGVPRKGDEVRLDGDVYPGAIWFEVARVQWTIGSKQQFAVVHLS